MGHSYTMRLHGVTLPIVVISDVAYKNDIYLKIRVWRELQHGKNVQPTIILTSSNRTKKRHHYITSLCSQSLYSKNMATVVYRAFLCL